MLSGWTAVYLQDTDCMQRSVCTWAVLKYLRSVDSTAVNHKQTAVAKQTKRRVTRFHASNYNALLSGLNYPLQFRRLLAITGVVIRARIDLPLFNGRQSRNASASCENSLFNAVLFYVGGRWRDNDESKQMLRWKNLQLQNMFSLPSYHKKETDKHSRAFTSEEGDILTSARCFSFFFYWTAFPTVLLNFCQYFTSCFVYVWNWVILK